MLRTTLLGAGLALAVGGVAAAQDAGRHGKADRDGDGRVSLAEMQAGVAEHFARADADRDGRITREERQAAHRTSRGAASGGSGADRGQRLQRMFAKQDADRDGALSQAEAPGRLGQAFAQLDANRDGRLTPTELQAGRAALKGQRKSSGGARPRADADSDGVVTRAEMDAQLRARFTALDANRDGFLTREEQRAGRAQRQGG